MDGENYELNYYGNRGNSSRNQNLRFDDNVDFIESERDHPTNAIHRHHRTLSKHRNVASTSGNSTRTLPRSLEERRAWEDYGAHRASEMEDHADQIVDRMELDGILMEDNPNAEQLRREALRDMPQCLTLKRRVKSKLTDSVSLKSSKKTLSCLKRWKYGTSMKISKWNNSIKGLMYTIQLWYSTLKKIEGHFGSGISSYFKFFRWIFLLDFFITIPALCFIVVPQIFHSNVNGGNESFSGSEIFTGDGYFTGSIFYYGTYSNESLKITEELYYNIPYAYFFTMLFTYGVFLIIFSLKTAKSYRKSFIETKGGVKNVFAHKIFCGWDYGIATEEAAHLKHSSIHLEIKELISDSLALPEKNKLMDKLRSFALTITAHILIFSLIVLTGYLMWDLMEQNVTNKHHSLLTAVIINIILLFFPLVFSFIARYEGHKNPRRALYINLFRIFFLEVVVVGILITFWLNQSKKRNCWETALGQEIYRLIVFDFIFSVLFLFVFELGRVLIYKFFWNNIGYQEFDIARHTLQLVYNQTLFWVGFFFSPLLSVVIIIKLFLTWYIRSWAVLYLCKPSARSWRAARAHTSFLMLSFICLLATTSILAYIIAMTETSNCGPFRNYETMLKAILIFDRANILWSIISYVFKPGVVALIFVALCVAIYYQSLKSKAQTSVVSILREMLVWEAKDKEFLLAHISKVTKGQWQYNIHDGRVDFFDPIKMIPRYRDDNRQGDTNDLMYSNSEDYLLPTSSAELPSRRINSDRQRKKMF